METWIINLFGGVATLIGTFSVMRYVVGELKKSQEAQSERLEKHGDAIVELQTRLNLAMTSKDVDDKYVSKELFRQFEKHIDNRFDEVKDSFKTLNDGQNQILSILKTNRER